MCVVVYVLYISIYVYDTISQLVLYIILCITLHCLPLSEIFRENFQKQMNI